MVTTHLRFNFQVSNCSVLRALSFAIRVICLYDKPFTRWYNWTFFNTGELKIYLHRYCNIGRETATHSQALQHIRCSTVRNPALLPKHLGSLDPSLQLQDFHLPLSRLWWAWCYLGWQRGTVLSSFYCPMPPFWTEFAYDSLFSVDAVRLCCFQVCLVCEAKWSLEVKATAND